MSHLHAWPAELECTALADGVCITEVNDGFLVGFAVSGEDRRPVGRVPTTAGHWQATGSLAAGTLTLTPSIDYRDGRQRRHGWVRDGRWVEA